MQLTERERNLLLRHLRTKIRTGADVSMKAIPRSALHRLIFTLESGSDLSDEELAHLSRVVATQASQLVHELHHGR